MGKVWGTYHRGGISHSTYTWNQPVHWTRRVPGSARPTCLGEYGTRACPAQGKFANPTLLVGKTL